jgi:3-hydroxyisobutyrate dehydrogenase
VSAKIGFIGIGNMGWPMAARLVQSGYDVTVTDISMERCQAFAEQIGGTTSSTPAGAAGRSDILITMLPTSAAVETAVTGPDGLLSTLREGALVIEMSSGEPTATRRMAGAVMRASGSLIDAPVSGGVARAESGELAIMVGGNPHYVDRARPILMTLGKSVVRTGEVGSAHAMKALNNLASAAGFLIGIEALLIGKRLGLDPSTMVDILNASSGMNNSTQKKFKQFVLSRKFDAGFSLDLMVKDISIALDMAGETATSAPFAALCREIWTGALKTLGPGRDHTELARYSEQLAGSTLS